jgi:hypothetical protein
MDHIGIDVHTKESQICILAEGGELIERRIHTEPQRFAAVLGDRPRARILIEASTDSEWVARCLEGVGHEVIVADPNFAPMYATRTRKVKTDRRDARAYLGPTTRGSPGMANLCGRPAGKAREALYTSCPLSSLWGWMSTRIPICRRRGEKKISSSEWFALNSRGPHRG